MVTTKDLIAKLKEVKEERQLSYDAIIALVEENGGSVSKASLSRIFSGKSDDHGFIETTLLPVANALLDVDTIEENDNTDERAMKTLLRYKSERLSELEKQLADIDVEYNKKMDSEREQWTRTINFLKNQIEKKDERIDTLFRLYTNLLEQYTRCPYNKKESK
jgi:bacterioferritin (cytochrome b1)